MKVKIWWQHRHQPFESRWIVESLTGDRILATDDEREIYQLLLRFKLDVVEGPSNFMYPDWLGTRI